MKKYLVKLSNLIMEYGKPQVAVWLGVNDTRTIDAWLYREMIPGKYLDILEDL